MSRLGVVGATLAGVVIAAVAGYVAMREAGERDAAPGEDERTTSAVDWREQAVATTTVPAEQPLDPGGSLPDDVAYACPDFQVSTDLCVAALDRRYLDLAPSSFHDGILDPIVQPAKAMTLRQVFDEPEGKRRAIENAWNDPVCAAAWPPVGTLEGWSGAIRRDVAERCRADAMAEFSALVELCAVGGGYPRIAEGDREHAIERLDAIEDNQVYWEERAAFEYEYLGKLWLAAKCRRLEPSTLAPLHEYVDTGDGFMDFLNYLGDVHLLRHAAAWLGQEWAVVQKEGPRSTMYIDALRDAAPLRYHVHEAYRLRGKGVALTHVLAASKLAARQGVEIDSDALFDLAGEYGLDDLEAADRAALKLLGQSGDGPEF